MHKTKAAAAVLISLALAGCASVGHLQETGVLQAYSPCPGVAILAPAGDVTLFDPATSRDSHAIDVVATITNLRGACQEAGEYLVTTTNFEVQARRRDNRGAREVVLPYFAAVVQGGDNIVAKRVSHVALRFRDGEYRASTNAAATAQVLTAAASLPPEIRTEITRNRRPGDPSAAIDPLSIPSVRAAVQRARFELFLGFDLSEDQLRYNATR